MTGPGPDKAAPSGLSVRDMIDQRAEASPGRDFIIDTEAATAVSYSDLRAAARTIAAHIAGHGVKPGESVAYAMTNGAPAALVILGMLYGGYRATAINLVAGNDTISYVLDHSEARLVVADSESAPIIRAALDGLPAAPPVLQVTEEVWAQPAPTSVPQGAPDADADGLLMYTSGTTGRPKGVVLTHASLIAGGMNTAQAHRLGEGDRALCVLPLYHINGLCVTLIGPLISGGSVVMPARFSVSGFWPTIRDNRCTWFSVVPTQISYLLDDAAQNDTRPQGLETVRFGRSASAPLAPDVHRAFEEQFGIPIIETMGLTETAAQILSNPLPTGVRKMGSPGQAVGNEVKIADETQTELPPGTVGEVLVRGPNVMRCYLKNEDATRAALTQDGWLRTGDLGRMDTDGYVFITGRLKETIVKGGENIAPREVDEALYGHPDVVEAAAFACDCRHFGQRIEAAVVLTAGSVATEANLLALCRDRIGRFKAPDRIHFLDDLPKGPSGKIQRFRLAELVPENEEPKP